MTQIPPVADATSFKVGAQRVMGSPPLRKAYAHVTDRFIAHRTDSLAEVDSEALFAQAREIRADAVARLPELIAQFTAAVEARGGHVHMAADSEAARKVVGRIATQHGVQQIVKSKSMVTEEIGLNPALEALGLEVTETDLGERIVQLAEQPPAHIIAPSIEFDRHRVSALFQRYLGAPPSRDITELTLQAREALRRAFQQADMGITGANFLVAETGTAVTVTNEGNGRFCAGTPPLHVVVTGVEKLLPRLADLGVLLPTLTRSSTGQRLTSYIQLLTGPSVGPDGKPRPLHIVLVDNGRFALAADPDTREVLRCIRCSSCLNVCPIYHRAGGQAYGFTYPGPIGAVLNGLLPGPSDATTLAKASTLCGRCKEVCPVDIDLPNWLLKLRRGIGGTPAAAKTDGTARLTKIAARLFCIGSAHPRLWRLAAWLGNKVLAITGNVRGDWASTSPVPWTDARDVKVPVAQSFQAWWQQQQERSK